MRGIAVDHYLPEFSPGRRKTKWHIEIITVNELLDPNGIGYSESKLPSFQIEHGDNNVTQDEIKNCVILDEHHYRGYQGKNTKLDVTFVLGQYAGEKIKSLLVAPFYRQYVKCPSPTEVHTLFNSVMMIVNNHGIERN